MKVIADNPIRSAVLTLAFLFTLAVGAHAQPRILNTNNYHLGVAGQPEWQWFEGQTPFSNRLEVRFSSERNDREATLFIRQTDVKLDWPVLLNGRKLGTLFLMEEPLVHSIPVPSGVLKNGENILSFVPPVQPDDIIIGEISLDRAPLEEAVNKTKLEVQILDKDTGESLPGRITIVDNRGDLAPIKALAGQALAVRPGVVYTGNGLASLGLLPGDYIIHATRGFEYGSDRQTVNLKHGSLKKIKLRIGREVSTDGWIACDTHVHTFTYARHGDATIDERMLTLAGEGIELPISTEHNVLVDFSEAARRMNVLKFFTPVVGCEVTTDTGHFNAFPIDRGAKPPDHRLSDWPKLMDAIRSTAGVKVVVLNHPRGLHSGFIPFAPANFDAVKGENRRGPEFSFDAMEVINSGAMQSDWMLPFRDWFALLNHGSRVTAVASSDCHDVSRFIVGQGRTYVAGDDRKPGQIDVATACDAIRRGQVIVSLGLFTKMMVDGHFGVADLATGLGKHIQVQVEVLAPSWINADRVELFANGIKIRESSLEALSPRKKKQGKGNAWKVSWDLERPEHDCYLVAIASGPGVTEPYWPLARPYQPSSRAWTPRVIGATNPIWIDADGDGKFSLARATDQK